MRPGQDRAGSARRRLLVAGLAGLLAGGAKAQGSAQGAAQGSTQVIRLVVGYAAGGPVDTAARLIAPALARELGQPVVVDNRPGAGGVMGGDLVARATPNGLLLYFAASPTMTITPHLLRHMAFDPARDLTAVAPVLSYSNVLVVNKDQPFRTVPELVAYAKSHPGQLAYGSAGVGASNHLSAELFARRAGIQMTHVPYKGNAPAMGEVIGGQINMMFDIIGSARNYVAAGQVRALAVTAAQRNASLPEVPTFAEVGVPDFEVGGWYGLYGPPRLPTALVERLNAGVRRALSDEALKARLQEQGYELWVGGPQLLAQRAARDLALWAGVTQGMEVD